MKYVALTFDDGRSDNYSYARKIMNQYGFKGTVYITTGFIDGTWDEKDVLKSPSRPLSVKEIQSLYESGWEIGIHGDKHITDVDDTRVALNKLNNWKINPRSWGISIPNSSTTEYEINKLINSEYGNCIKYIRRGRKTNKKNIINILLYIVYNYLKFQFAYNGFNRNNYLHLADVNIKNIPSVVVKSNDDANVIVNYIKKIPDDTIVVLMLHSILPLNHELCGVDPWSWDETNFNTLCLKLNKMKDVKVLPLIDILKG